jgi:hypothetical protein
MIFALTFTFAAAALRAQTMRDTAALLPESDVIIFGDMRRILTEALPQMFAKDPVTLTQISAEIDKVKAETGIDIRQFERLAVGYRAPRTGAGFANGEFVVVLQGSFNTDALLLAAKLALKDRLRDERHNGKTIYLMKTEKRSRAASNGPSASVPANMKEIAVAAINHGTIVAGVPAAVRRALDTETGASQALVALATRDESALIGMAANILPSLKTQLGGAPADDPLMKAFDSVTQVYAAMNMEGTNLGLAIAALTDGPEQAAALHQSVLALKDQITASLPDPRLRDLFNSVQTSLSGNEVQARFEMPLSMIASLTRQPPARTRRPVRKRRPATRRRAVRTIA